MLKCCIIILFRNSSMLLLLFPCKSCYYVRFMLISKLSLNSKRDKHPSHWRPSLPALHPHCCHQWSECHCPHAGHCLTHFSELSQLTQPILVTATWRFACVPCYYSCIMLKCFAILPILWSLCTLGLHNIAQILQMLYMKRVQLSEYTICMNTTLQYKLVSITDCNHKCSPTVTVTQHIPIKFTNSTNFVLVGLFIFKHFTL